MHRENYVYMCMVQLMMIIITMGHLPAKGRIVWQRVGVLGGGGVMSRFQEKYQAQNVS